jgi:Protein of unknown function (DUF3082)
MTMADFSDQNPDLGAPLTADSSDQNSTAASVDPGPSAQMPTPSRCFSGAVVAAGLSFAAYNLMQAIALNFATHPLASNKLVVQRISAAVRTLVLGMSTLATGVFGFAALGLVGLGLQLLLKPKPTPTPPSSPS